MSKKIKRPLLFNRFYRIDEARTRNRGGMGLGLAIAKEFILAHGGTIEAESQPGEGTTFITTWRGDSNF